MAAPTSPSKAVESAKVEPTAGSSESEQQDAQKAATARAAPAVAEKEERGVRSSGDVSGISIL